MKRRCQGCGERFHPHRAVRYQRYCSSRSCQKERKRRWQAQKRATDADYRANQAAAQRAWRSRNRDYWRAYRKKNPEAAERNRAQQRERNRRRPERRRGGRGEEERLGPMLTIPAGRYRMIPLGDWGGGEIAKMDELVVELGVIPRLGAD